MQQLHFRYKNLHIPSLGLVALLLVSLASPSRSSCRGDEKSCLLQFLEELSRDGGLATAWRGSGTDCCRWEGITCGEDGTVTHVSLPSWGLEGSISPSLWNLTGLRHLNLSHNSLTGGLPLELAAASSIAVIDVSFNRLNGSLPELPSSSTMPAGPLKVLNLSSNSFEGRFPSGTWKAMENLIALNASNNSFSGQIPADLCRNSPLLAALDLCFNEFSGGVPPGLGDCSMLIVLKAGYNRLRGTIPDELFNATSLEELSFRNNDLHGALDGSPIISLRNLKTLDLGGNNFSGKIPGSIGQLKKLEVFHLDHNSMSGELPSALSSCTNLMTIDLKNNKFSGELAKVNFSNLSSLKTLDLYLNNFTGTVPESIYSCSNLTALRLSSNMFQGQISPRISNLKYLTFLSLADNSFKNITGALGILKSCRNLTTLLIGTNFVKELMPQDDRIDGFENLQVLDISSCELLGEIPLWISKLANLEVLILHSNQLSGPIPSWINSLDHLFWLDIGNNSLTAEIPTALMNMPMLKAEKSEPHWDPRVFELPVYNMGPSLQYRVLNAFPKALDLSDNELIGEIPFEIGQLKALISVNFSFNNLTGHIPQLICDLTNLETLDLSMNNLTGAIPAALSSLHFLSTFNVSNNDLEGPIPSGGQFNTFQNSSFDGNPKLCGSMFIHKCGSASTPLVSRRKRNKKAISAIAFGVFFGGVAIVFLLLRVFVSIRPKGSDNDGDIEVTSLNSSSEQTLVVMQIPRGNGEERKLKFIDILKATDNFKKENIIGCGGYGSVYRADLPDGTKLAIKKLNGEMCLMEREFTAEVDALSMAQHENLVPLWGYCVQGNSRLLIYSFMENGSLDDWLHNRDDDAGSFLHWPTRLKIAQGASLGLSYIHHVCRPHIVHRDIKSSNILLDRDFKAYVADFGLARLILPTETHVTTQLIGTMGYIPPEYGQSWVATLRGDIYSFGVVLLELITGRRPVPIISTSKELVPWVLEMRSLGRQIEVLDPKLRDTGHEEQMLKVLEEACKCVNRNQFERPSIMEVVSCLASIDADLHTQKPAEIE